MQNVEEKASWRDKPSRDLRNGNRVNLWTLIWTIIWLTAEFLFSREVVTAGPIIVLLMTAFLAAPIRLIFVYKRFLSEADELSCKIQLEALSLSMGITLVGTVGYGLLVRASLLTKLEVTPIVMLMVLSYMSAVIAGNRRYS